MTPRPPLSLRLPAALLAELRTLAAERDLKLNRLVVTLLGRATGPYRRACPTCGAKRRTSGTPA